MGGETEEKEPVAIGRPDGVEKSGYHEKRTGSCERET